MSTRQESRGRPTTLPARGAIVLFAVALLLRVAAIFALDSPAEISKGAYAWGFEAASIAQSVLDGHGYAGPWTRDAAPWSSGSGATAWLPPAYPGLLAWLFGAFGSLTSGLAVTLFVLQGVFAAWTCVCLWALGAAIGEERAGKLAGWILAFYPAAIWHAAHTVWDTTLAAFALTAFAWALFGFRASGPRGWALLGVGFGALLLVNPAPLSIAPVVAWMAWRERASVANFLARGLAFALAAIVVITPWCLRNQRAVGAFALRTNLGVEMRAGNNDASTGHFQVAYHPSNSATEFMRYRELGEVPYAGWAMREARLWIGDNPGRFAALTLRRARVFWLGEDPLSDPRRDDDGRAASHDAKSWIKWLQYSAFGVAGLAGAILLARRRAEGRALLAMLLLFPLAYYVTHVMERYRYPIEPIIVLCAALLVLAIVDRARQPART